MLLDKIREAQLGNQDTMLELIETFKPLMRKLAYKLGSEDAYQEMILAFIVLIYNFKVESQRNKSEGALVMYISRSMQHQYASILKKEVIPKKSELSLDELEENHALKQSQLIVEDEIDTVFNLLYTHDFSKDERRIILMIFRDGYSAAEISRRKGVSRQNVNQIKKRALLKLKSQLCWAC